MSAKILDFPDRHAVIACDCGCLSYEVEIQDGHGGSLINAVEVLRSEDFTLICSECGKEIIITLKEEEEEAWQKRKRH